MTVGGPEFRKPSRPEQLFNRLFGVLVRFGLAPRYNYLVEVRGRKTGRVQSAPINVVEVGSRLFLVAPRGRTQWVRNAEAAGEVVLTRGASRRRFRLRSVTGDEKLNILKAYLDRHRLAVQRYFTVRAGSDARAFAEIAGRYPVFELLAVEDAPPR
jgi:deazaflavin-dependent oxidoreductase (nitroreductase family)